MTSTQTQRSALAPDPQSLSDRGRRAWLEEMAVRPLGTEYAVDSTSEFTYIVDLANRECTCPDHKYRGQLCKHLRRVAIEITLGRVPPPGRRWADCVVCGTDTVVEFDDRNPALCSFCDYEPGEILEDRNTGDKVMVLRVTDRRADEVSVPTTGQTVAEYSTNEGYPDDDLVVEVVYLTQAGTPNPTQYSFPHSRLQ